ncbi:jg15193, partial [Pararge aegeria aegeria]
SALTEIPIETRSSELTIPTPDSAASENEPGPSTSALNVSSATIQLQKAIPTMNDELAAASVSAAPLATLQEAVPNSSVDVGNVNDVLKNLLLSNFDVIAL